MHQNVSIILSQTVKWTWTSHTELRGWTGHLELMAGPPVTETVPRHHHKWRPYLLYSRNVNSFKWICYRIKIFLAGYIQIFLFIAARQWICLLFMVQVEETMRFSCSPSRYHITAQTLQWYICTWRGTAGHMLTSERYFMSLCWHQRDTWYPECWHLRVTWCPEYWHQRDTWCPERWH